MLTLEPQRHQFGKLTNMKKIIFGSLLVVALVGAYFFPHFVPTVASPTGTQFGTQKTATVIFSPTTASASTTALYNSDQSDRIITDVKYYCSGVGTSRTFLTGAGLDVFTFQAATTSVTTGLGGNTNYVLATTVATSSTSLYVATTTPGLTGTVTNRIWPAGTYLTYIANATNTAVCSIATDYVQR